MNRSKIILALACLAPLLGFWTYGLFDLDEGFYGAVVKDMIRRGDWITPTLNGTPWFEKPILSYWLAIPFVSVFPNEFGARLPSAICTILTILAWWKWSSKNLPSGVREILVLGYAGSLLVVGIGRMMMTDAPLVLFFSLAMMATFDAITRGEAKWKVGIWMGFAILAKGPVAPVLWLGTLLIWWFFDRGVANRAKGWTVPILIAAVIAATWVVPSLVVNRDVFVQKFLIEQNIGRFAGGDKAHAVPLYLAPFYFPPVLILACMPLVFFGWRGFWQNVRSQWKREETDHAMTFLFAWMVAVLGFFTISGSKLPHYILPGVGPAIALLAVATAKAAEDRRSLLIGLAGWNCAILALAQAVFGSIYQDQFLEVRRLAQKANYMNLPIATVALSGSRDATGLTQNETSNPSFGFYSNQAVREGKTLDDLIKLNWSGVVLTRKDRIGVDEVQLARLLGWNIDPIDLSGSRYELWHLRRTADADLQR